MNPTVYISTVAAGGGFKVEVKRVKTPSARPVMLAVSLATVSPRTTEVRPNRDVRVPHIIQHAVCLRVVYFTCRLFTFLSPVVEELIPIPRTQRPDGG